MVFKLGSLCAIDGPVPRIMDAGCYFVDQQLTLQHEKFQRQNSHIREVIQQAAHNVFRSSLQGVIEPPRQTEHQDAIHVQVAGQEPETGFSVDAPDANQRAFLFEGHIFLHDQIVVTQLLPGALQVFLVTDNDLALTVITQAAGLQYDRIGKLVQAFQQVCTPGNGVVRRHCDVEG